MTRDLNTNRFGPIRIESEDILHFPAGLLGMEDCRDWILLGDGQNDAVAWLQSVENPRVALPVVSPRRFVPDYRMRVARMEVEPLELDDLRAAEVLLVVGRSERGLTLNLKAPLVIHVSRRLGRQVITNGDLPIRYEIRTGQLPGQLFQQSPLKKTA
jgi:flagellar assembly factor FliW